MAEGIFRHKVRERGLPFETDSAGTGDWHVGEAPDRRMQGTAADHGVDITDLRGRQFTAQDFDRFDHIFVMDESNYTNVIKLARNEDDREKVEMMLDVLYPGERQSVPDPYFGGQDGFEHVFDLLDRATEEVLKTRNMKGRLLLVPSALAEDNAREQFPESTLNEVYQLRSFIAERAKTARRFLRSIGYSADFDSVQVQELNKHGQDNNKALLQPCLNGQDIGLISEAGVPGVADPGGSIVREAHALGIRVVPMIGASSLLLALMASGMNGQAFQFHGYLPRDQHELVARIKQLERHSKEQNLTQLFIETPYRNDKLLQVLLSTLDGNADLCVAADLTSSSEKVLARKVVEWKKTKHLIGKSPAVFLLFSGFLES